MARHRKRNLTSPRQRDILKTPIASRRLLPDLIKVRTQRQLLLDNSRLFGNDNRTYHPRYRKTSRPVRTVTGLVASTSYPKNKPLRTVRPQFAVPDRVVACVRRGVRKEVLHALKKTRAGSRSKNRRYTEASKTKC